MLNQINAEYAPGLREGVRGLIIEPCRWVSVAERLSMMLGRPAAELATLIAKQVDLYSLSPEEEAHKAFNSGVDFFGKAGREIALSAMHSLVPEARPRFWGWWWNKVWGQFLAIGTKVRQLSERQYQNAQRKKASAWQDWLNLTRKYEDQLYQLGRKYGPTSIPEDKYQAVMRAYDYALAHMYD